MSSFSYLTSGRSGISKKYHGATDIRPPLQNRACSELFQFIVVIGRLFLDTNHLVPGLVNPYLFTNHCRMDINPASI